MRPPIQTFVPDMLPIDLVSYYDEFKDYYPFCEPATKRWFVENIKPDWTIFDCGANIGYFSILFARLAFNGHVYAFEPTETYQMLLENLKYNKVNNVSAIRLALGESSGYIEENIYRIWGSDPERLKYPFTTIDSFVQHNNISRVDCIKIDVDSFDFEVLKGAKKTLMAFDPYVMVELNHALNQRHQSNMEALEWLAELGYTETVIIDYDNFLLKKEVKVSATANTTSRSLSIFFECSHRDGSLSSRGIEALNQNSSGTNLFAVGNMGGALSVFEKIIQDFPEHPRAYNNAGVTLNAMNDTVKARLYLKAGLDIAPNDKMMLRNYITLLTDSGKTLEAVAICVKYLKTHSNDSEIINLMKKINMAVSCTVTLPEGNTILVPIVSVIDLHTHLGFEVPLEYPLTSIDKPFYKWKMEVDDSPIFRYIYRNFKPERHLEFGTWQGTGTLYCLEESQATVWTINMPTGEILPDGQNAYTSLAYDRKEEEFLKWADKANFSIKDLRSDTFGFVGWQYLEAGLGHRVCQIFCNSLDWNTNNIPNGFFDTILVDGSHEKDIVINDTRKALPLLKSGGIIMWHDCCPPEYMNYGSTIGVMKALGAEWETLENELAQLFWIKPSWILLGVKK